MAYLSLGHQRVSVLGALPAFGVGILHNCRDFSTVHSGSAIRARRLESKFSGVEVIMVSENVCSSIVYGACDV